MDERDLLTVELDEIKERLARLEHLVDDLKALTIEALEMRLRWLEQQSDKAQTSA